MHVSLQTYIHINVSINSLCACFTVNIILGHTYVTLSEELDGRKDWALASPAMMGFKPHFSNDVCFELFIKRLLPSKHVVIFINIVNKNL